MNLKMNHKIKNQVFQNQKQKVKVKVKIIEQIKMN